MDPGHGGGYSHPPRGKTPGTTCPSEHTGNPAPDGTEVSRALGREDMIHAPCGARISGSPVPHPTGSDPGGSGPGMAVAILSLRDRCLAGPRATGGV